MQEEVALQALHEAKMQLETAQEPGDENVISKEAAENISITTDAIDKLFYAIRYNADLDAAFFWRAEAYRIRAMSRRPPEEKNDSQTAQRKAREKKTADLRAALGDVDHCLRFYDPDHIEGEAQMALAWQLRGRIRAALKIPEFTHDFDTSLILDGKCAMTSLLYGRCLWRMKKFELAQEKLRRAIEIVHTVDIRQQIQTELDDCVKQQKLWEVYDKEEEERQKCIVM